MVDLSGLAAKCSCPSRKFPCKHGLALMFLAASGKAGASASEPEDVSAWLTGRTRRSEAAATRTTATVPDEKTVRSRERDRERRAAQREDRVAAGMDEFRRWLQDLARRGLADVDQVPAYHAAATRLVDAQAGELARDVRALARTVALEGVGSDGVLDRIGLLFLVCETWDRRETLDARLAAEVRSRIGWTVREADLPESEDVTDDWVVVARRHEDDDRLRETRTWLRGATTGRWVVLLDFAPIRTEPANEPPVGTGMTGRVGIYPGASGLRGVLRAGWQADARAVQMAGAEDHAAALATYRTAVAGDPFLERWPLAIDGVQVAWDRDTDRMAIVDRTGSVLPVRLERPTKASLLAFSGGRPVAVAGEWDGHALDVLAAGDGDVWIGLPGTERSTIPTFATNVESATSSDDPTWAALAALATLGTGRAEPDPILAPLAARMADRTPEDRLLAMISALAVRRRLTSGSVAAAADLPILPPAAAEALTRPPVTIALAVREPTRRELRDERLSILLDHGWLVPLELLPSEAMAPPVPDPRVLGHRAAWLARFVSGYRPWGADVEDVSPIVLRERLEDPSTGPVERQAYMRAWRGDDPASAGSWLEAAWGGLSANDKAMVAALRVGLSAADTAFLERILQERNRDRRDLVAGLLAHLPDSAFVQRVEARGTALVERKGRLGTGLRLRIPPDTFWAELEADGHAVSTHQWKGGPARTPEERAWEALDWHLRHIRPARWCEWLGLSVGQVVDEIAKLAPKRWGYSAYAPLAAAAVAHGDHAFATVLVEHVTNVGDTLDALWALIPASDRASVATRVMANPSKYDVGESTTGALRALRGAWTPAARDVAAIQMLTYVDHLSGRDRWTALGRLRAFVTGVPIDLLPAIIDRLSATDADSRDILDIAESRQQFARIVAEARGVT
jgi:hypothetical protein